MKTAMLAALATVVVVAVGLALLAPGWRRDDARAAQRMLRLSGYPRAVCSPGSLWPGADPSCSDGTWKLHLRCSRGVCMLDGREPER